jgi:hypothetical protein
MLNLVKAVVKEEKEPPELVEEGRHLAVELGSGNREG